MDPALASAIISASITLVVNLFVYVFAIGQYKNKVDTLEKDRDDTRKKAEDMKSELDKLLEFKVYAQKFIDSKIYESKSPLTLTEYGQKLVDDSGFNEIFEEVKDDIVQKLEAEELLTPYDVQEQARALMGELDDYSAFEPLKKYAFDNGVDYKQILRAGAIPLRDYYLEQHKEIQK